jgi:ubiquinol-cytochrome c reductase cytochrome b subunit
VPDKLLGVIIMGGAVLILFAVPWLDRGNVKSIRYRGLPSKIALLLFSIAFVWLGYIGAHQVSDFLTMVARISTFVYFAFFFTMPWWSRMGTDKPVPDRVTMPH